MFFAMEPQTSGIRPHKCKADSCRPSHRTCSQDCPLDDQDVVFAKFVTRVRHQAPSASHTVDDSLVEARCDLLVLPGGDPVYFWPTS